MISNGFFFVDYFCTVIALTSIITDFWTDRDLPVLNPSKSRLFQNKYKKNFVQLF